MFIKHTHTQILSVFGESRAYFYLEIVYNAKYFTLKARDWPKRLRKCLCRFNITNTSANLSLLVLPSK